jgi:hypothetical protein
MSFLETPGAKTLGEFFSNPGCPPSQWNSTQQAAWEGTGWPLIIDSLVALRIIKICLWEKIEESLHV